MKKFSLWVLFILLTVSAAFGLNGAIEPGSLSLKAGPTEPGEKLSLVWVESFVYPKTVREERVISLGVRTAARVSAVSASFDFDGARPKLASADGRSWSGTYKLPDKLAEGVHIVRYRIGDRRGTIQRTVEFFVEKSAPVRTAANVSRGEAAKDSGWPLTIISTCTAYTNNSTRTVGAGQVLVSVAKMPWYKVVFKDGQEGWVPSSYAKEPTEDYYLQGYSAYQAKNYPAAIKFYQNAVAIDQNYVKGYVWLAKSYLAGGELESATEAVKQALRLDERDLESRVVAEALAQNYYSAAHRQFRLGRLNEAAAGFRKVIELKPDSLAARLELGQSFRRLGLESEATDAWKEALKYDVDNKEIRALLGVKEATAAADRPSAAGRPKIAGRISPVLADDSLQIIKKVKTYKGTGLEAALKSVIGLTKSLGTPISEKGWQIRRQGEKFLVSYLCEQSGGALETFDWLVDVDTRQVMPRNENARVLMSRW